MFFPVFNKWSNIFLNKNLLSHTSILTMYDCIASAPSLEGGVNYSKIAFNTIRKGSLQEFQNPNDGQLCYNIAHIYNTYLSTNFLYRIITTACWNCTFFTLVKNYVVHWHFYLKSSFSLFFTREKRPKLKFSCHFSVGNRYSAIV